MTVGFKGVAATASLLHLHLPDHPGAGAGSGGSGWVSGSSVVAVVPVSPDDFFASPGGEGHETDLRTLT